MIWGGDNNGMDSVQMVPPAFDLSHELVLRLTKNGKQWCYMRTNELIYATIDVPADGKVRQKARTVHFGTGVVMEVTVGEI